MVSDTGRIIVVGGYGQVGLSVAERLAPLFPGRIVIAGRSLDKATRAAADVGHGAEGRMLDIFEADSDALDDDVALGISREKNRRTEGACAPPSQGDRFP